MAASLTRLIRTLPLPLFGSAQTAVSFTIAKSKTLPRLAGWAVPATIGALWFVWPAVDEQWKIDMGFKSDPEAAAKAVADKIAKEEEKRTPVTLPSEVMAKVEVAYKAHDHHVETEDDKLLMKAASSGDFSYLEEKWEAFNEKAIRPGEDDDEEEEEEEDDEEEEGEEEEEDEDDDE